MEDFDAKWSVFENRCRTCSKCGLREGAQHVVIYRGGRTAPLMIVGEAPGEQEDIKGIPFCGRSGQLLQNLLASYGFGDEDYHICNIAKCRPPQNRRPTAEEIKACKPLLAEQFMHDVRGRFIEKNGYYIMTTYHPAYALRNPKNKMPIYEDMGKVRAKLEEIGALPPLAD